MLRKTITIISLVGLLLSVGLWGVSYWNVGYYSSDIGIMFRHGAIVGPCNADHVALMIFFTRVRTTAVDMRQSVDEDTENDRNKWLVGGYDGLRTTWLPAFGSPGRPLHLPLWMPITFFAMICLWPFIPFLRRRKRKKLGLCVKCGYDLRASKERCPECGCEFEKQ